MIDYNEVAAIETQIASRVRNFKRMNDTTWNWSCDVCGDSRKDTRKARFFAGSKNNGALLVYCHNCGYSASFKHYTEYKHPDVYRSLQQDSFFDNNTLFDYDVIIESADSDGVLKKLFFIDRFNNTDDWVAYLKKKKIRLSKKSFEKLLLLFRASAHFHQPF